MALCWQWLEPRAATAAGSLAPVLAGWHRRQPPASQISLVSQDTLLGRTDASPTAVRRDRPVTRPRMGRMRVGPTRIFYRSAYRAAGGAAAGGAAATQKLFLKQTNVAP